MTNNFLFWWFADIHKNLCKHGIYFVLKTFMFNGQLLLTSSSCRHSNSRFEVYNLLDSNTTSAASNSMVDILSK